MKHLVVASCLALVACLPSPPPPQMPPPAYASANQHGVPDWYKVEQAQVVPPEAAPPPPAGRGWHCFDVAVTKPSGAETSSRCLRTSQECTRTADSYRSQHDQQVGFCQPARVAYCSATFTNETDARYICGKALEHCGPVGGPAPMRGVKQSECAAVH